MTPRIKGDVSNETTNRIDKLAEMLGEDRYGIVGSMILYCLDVRQEEWRDFYINERREQEYEAALEAAEKGNRIMDGEEEVPPGMEKDEFIDMDTDEKVENVNEEYGLDIDLDEEDAN